MSDMSIAELRSVNARREVILKRLIENLKLACNAYVNIMCITVKSYIRSG